MENPSLVALIMAVGAGLICLAGVGVTLRVTGQGRALAKMIAVSLIVFVGAVSLLGSQMSFWHFSAFYAGAVAGLIFLYGAALKSLSLEILLEMARAKDQAAPLEDIAQRVTSAAFAERAELLVEMGAAERGSTGYVATASGALLAARICRVRELLKVDTLGLYGDR